jgi:hypothetical protein
MTLKMKLPMIRSLLKTVGRGDHRVPQPRGSENSSNK